ncbi:unnamed protein product [Ceutorhynchus assimilis]|uniref:Uncharacterized protein n=1 Tax=Ceutorhynchus assimilis TaxID=467358 RepID=A0A9N9MW24_9CUCU|nr:unnamed protein product [Ceutorhynchus assimilis]
MSGGDKKDKHNRPKRGLKLFFLPKIQGQKHKHKKNKYYFGQDDDHEGSIMSGDSPAHHNRTAEVFDYHPATSTLALEPKSGSGTAFATTSKDIGVQSKIGDKTDKSEVQASAVMVEPGGDKDDEDKEHFGSPTLNNSDNKGEKDENGEEKTGKFNDAAHEGNGRDKKDEKFHKNGNLDKLDGVWVPNNDKQKADDDGEEDDCIVKCLYVTMTCCECSIM